MYKQIAKPWLVNYQKWLFEHSLSPIRFEYTNSPKKVQQIVLWWFLAL